VPETAALLGVVEALADEAAVPVESLSVSVVALVVDAVTVDGEVVEKEGEEEVVDPVLLPELVVLAAVMLNWSDWARILLRSWVSLTRFTWNVPPVGQPALGGFTVVVPRVPSTRASRTRLFCGKTARFVLVRTIVKLSGSVSTRCQETVWAP